MGRPPAYIFVVRHGHRLDAADKQWHLTSPTPYDPPLTYGGWMHSRSVGARIAAILRDDTIDPITSSASKKSRRFRIVLHSSPFLRCVQTSVAISAGLAANPAPSTVSSNRVDTELLQPEVLRHVQASSFSNPAPSRTRPNIAIPTLATHHEHPHTHEPTTHIEKSVLRLDAFLGEWLSPEYFEHITPPPKSALMLATAKAELLRRSSYHDYPHFHVRVHSAVSSHLWSSDSTQNATMATSPTNGSHTPSGLDTLSNLAGSLPGHEGDSNRDSDHKGARGVSQGSQQTHGYVYPVPSYALSTSEPIPRGYVAHARDACVSIDYQWDSSRDNMAWGDGGTLPEEWASMHQRFRRGLGRLVDWYVSTDDAGEMVTRTMKTPILPDLECAVEDDDEEDDDEIEEVVVLVSHGAGCNALIGAITQQPVLTDVAMSSLTMAKRRPALDSPSIRFPSNSPLSYSGKAPGMSQANMADMYELKLLANTDHLVSTSNRRPLSRPDTRPRFNTGYTSALKDINFDSLYGGSRRASQGDSVGAASGRSALLLGPSVYNPNFGGITVGSGMSSFSAARCDRSGSGTWGLWSPKQDIDSQNKETEPPMFLDFSLEKELKSKESREAPQTAQPSTPSRDADNSAPLATINGKKVLETNGQDHLTENYDEEHDNFDEAATPRLWAGKSNNGGLWGAPTPPGEAERFRDFSASKRRWTVTER